MKDGETASCKRCGLAFHSVKRRKHHCRMCGLVVCDRCSKNRVQLKKTGKKSRVCNECFNQIAPRHMRSMSNNTTTHTETNTPSLQPSKISIEDEHDEQQYYKESDNGIKIHHEAATTDEVEEIIENLKRTAIKQRTELQNRGIFVATPSTPGSEVSWAKTQQLPQRTNTNGTFCEYEDREQSNEELDDEPQVTEEYHKQTDSGHEFDDEEPNKYSYESPAQPLLHNNGQSRCCNACIIL